MLITHLDVMCSVDRDTSCKRVVYRVIPDVRTALTGVEAHMEMDWVSSWIAHEIYDLI